MNGTDMKKFDGQIDKDDDNILGEEYLDDERPRKPRGNRIKKLRKVADLR